MPPLDRFRPPFADRGSWEGFHGMWPAAIVKALAPRPPECDLAEPRVHLGPEIEIDLATSDAGDEDAGPSAPSGAGGEATGVPTAVWAPPGPTPAGATT